MSSKVTDQTRKQANLKLLQRTCSPDITDISVSATHVVLYEYRGDAWHKSGIEGSLFVVQRIDRASNSLSHQLIVLNRHSTDNLIVVLTANFQVQHQNPYLIFKQQRSDNSQEAAAPRVRGIWFHSDEERGNVFAVLQRTLQTIQQHEAALAAVMAQEPPAALANNNAADTTTAADASAALASLFVGGGAAAAASPARTSSAPPSATTAPPPPAAVPAVAAAAAAAAASNSPGPAVLPPEGVALDKKSLQLALLSLIQDDRFLDLLHSQYLRVVHARAAKSKQQGGNGNNNK